VLFIVVDVTRRFGRAPELTNFATASDELLMYGDTVALS
jgi:hypothetical protein